MNIDDEGITLRKLCQLIAYPYDDVHIIVIAVEHPLPVVRVEIYFFCEYGWRKRRCLP